MDHRCPPVGRRIGVHRDLGQDDRPRELRSACKQNRGIGTHGLLEQLTHDAVREVAFEHAGMRRVHPDPTSGRTATGFVEQRALADTGGSFDHEHRAEAGQRRLEGAVERPEFSLAFEQAHAGGRASSINHVTPHGRRAVRACVPTCLAE
jgi:hypothetical protein